MDWFSGIVVFLLIWWTALFVVLPWGIKHDESEGTGAPVQPRIKQKVLITTGLTLILWVIVYILVEVEVISFYDISKAMFNEDMKL